jgi:hypothetical protein
MDQIRMPPKKLDSPTDAGGGRSNECNRSGGMETYPILTHPVLAPGQVEARNLGEPKRCACLGLGIN